MSDSDAPALVSLAALIPGGLSELDTDVAKALSRDDFAGAMRVANSRYSQTDGRSVKDALTYAILLTHRELADEALGVLRKAMTYNASDIALQLAQVDALFAKGELDSAEQLMEALTVSLRDPRHWGYLGDMYWDLDLRVPAQDAYEEAMRAGTHDPDVPLRLAELYADQDDFWAAAESFETAGRLAPADAHVWTAVTEAWLGLGAWDRAIHAAKRTTKLAPDSGESWALLGAAHREAGSTGDALMAFEKARNLDPMDPAHWLNLGALQLDLGLPEEARQSYVRAASLDGRDVEAVNGQVAAAYDLGDVDLAQRLARRALELDPDHPDALYNYGVVSLSLHQADIALGAFEQALEADPLNAHVLAGRATALLLLGAVDEALIAAHTALEVDKEDAELVLEFTQFLFRYAGASQVLDFVRTAPCEDPAWLVLVPLFEFIAHALRRDGEFDAAYGRFVDAVKAHPEAIPLPWEFDELERLGFGLDDDVQGQLQDLLSVVDGRRDVSELAKRADAGTPGA